jgi:hypothetical protein
MIIEYVVEGSIMHAWLPKEATKFEQEIIALEDAIETMYI